MTTLESELNQSSEIEVVTDSTDSDADKNFDDVDDLDNSIDRTDYDPSTDDPISSSSSTSGYPINDCLDDDEIMSCPRNHNFKICESMMCDGISQCPNGEDETPEQCSSGECTILNVLGNGRHTTITQSARKIFEIFMFICPWLHAIGFFFEYINFKNYFSYILPKKNNLETLQNI